MKHRNELRGALICIGVLLLLILVMMLTSCGRRQDAKRFDLVQRDELGSIIVYLVKDTTTKQEYIVFAGGHGIDVVEVDP